jgi:hypothetical protein
MSSQFFVTKPGGAPPPTFEVHYCIYMFICKGSHILVCMYIHVYRATPTKIVATTVYIITGILCSWLHAVISRSLRRHARTHRSLAYYRSHPHRMELIDEQPASCNGGNVHCWADGWCMAGVCSMTVVS